MSTSTIKKLFVALLILAVAAVIVLSVVAN